MRITETRDINEVLKCLPMEIEIQKKGRDVMPIKDLLSVLNTAFTTNPNLRFFMAYDENEGVLGYMVLILYPDKEYRSIQIYRIWTNGKKEILESFIEIIKTLAKEFRCKKIIIVTRKNTKALKRKWGFKVSSTIMERSI